MEPELVAEQAHSVVDCTDTAVAQDIAMHTMAAVAVRCTDLALHLAAAAHLRIESM